MNPEELKKDEMAIQKELFLWYYDAWLPAILPREFWREDIRFYRLLTDACEIAGKQKVLVTVASEAFGLLMWENCRNKWVNYFIKPSGVMVVAGKSSMEVGRMRRMESSKN
jgi:hypothetical protein